MKFRIWADALRGIPRISKADWQTFDVVAKWLIATRSAVLVMTLFSCAIGGLFALRDGLFDGKLFALNTLGLLFAHATNNLLNDLTDHLKGTDRDNSFRAQYGAHPIEHGLMTKTELLVYAAVTGGIALVIGGYLAWLRGSDVLYLLLAGAFFVLFYTYPLKYFGLGEIAVLAVWGPLMVGGTYLVVTGKWSNAIALASLPYGLCTTTVIFGKHIDKAAMDRERHVRTLPVIIGERAARYIAIAMLLLQYLAVFYLVYIRFVGLSLLVVAVALPSLYRVLTVYVKPRPTEPPEELPHGVWPLWFVALAFWHTRRFGALFLLGLILDVILHRFAHP